MRRNFLLTVDAEQDISKYLSNSFVGIERGIPFLLDVFKELDMRATFFIQGLVCDRFPEIVLEVERKGHTIGCHGYHHIPYGIRSKAAIQRDVKAGVASIRRLIGKPPELFRAVEFSLTSNLVAVLEENGFQIDSSALPNYRRALLWGLIRRPIKNIPEEPYLLSRTSRPRGRGLTFEVPATENPRFSGAPLGVGFLNLRGPEETKIAMNEVTASYCTFIIHPWEVVDLPSGFRQLPAWVREISRRDEESLKDFLGWVKDTATVTGFFSLIKSSSVLPAGRDLD